MSLFSKTLFWTRVQSTHHARRHYSLPATRPGLLRRGRAAAFALSLATTGVVAANLVQQPIFLDAHQISRDDVVVDEDSGVEFPKIIRIQSKAKLPDFQLVGVGVRTVSFLGIRVYAIGFYADLASPNLKISASATPEEKVEHIVRNAACVIRIVPTRTTNYTHLRDAFVRAVQTRLTHARADGLVTADDEFAAQGPIRQLKTLFPNKPFPKGDTLDILLTAPEPNGNRALIFRDLGVVQDAWVTREFVLNYLTGKAAPSPPLQKMVLEKMKSYGTSLL